MMNSPNFNNMTSPSPRIPSHTSTTTTTTTTTPNPNSSSTKKIIHTVKDEYLSNDFYPLQQANKAIISALRSDEISSNGDLYKRIAMSNSTTSNYLLLDNDDDDDDHTNDKKLNGDNNRNGGYHSNTNGQSFRSPQSNQQQQQQRQQVNSNLDAHTTYKYTSTIPLPSTITQMIQSQTKVSSLMGILPQGNMVWVSVDDALYLWEYGDSLDVGGSGMSGGSGSGGSGSNEDFVCFKVPSGQCIVSVGLVKPKQGVFKDIVEWCLVVTTHEEVIICALARESMTVTTQQQQSPFSSPLFSPRSTSSAPSHSDTHLKLIPTRYIISTDSVPMLCICGTDDGRIFMGGYDGCLYEMSYEGFVPSTTSLSSSTSSSMMNGNSHPTTPLSKRGGEWYDDYDDYNDEYNMVSPSVVDTIASGSKRALSALIFGPSSYSSSIGLGADSARRGKEARARKCRKINHTSFAPQIVSAFVPGFVLNAASYVFGSNTSTRSGGPIVKLTLDKERKTLYALTSKGFIHAFDLGTNRSSKNGISSSGISVSATPKLACTIDVSKSVRKFLDCVAHGKFYAQSVVGVDGTIASIQFPGGSTAAQAGVGGMEGARSILKIADSEMMRKKQAQSNRSGRVNTRGSNNGKGLVVGDGCLHPISIHVVPPSESKSLTLVAISTAGLRYYLSVLPDATSNRFGTISMKPGHRFSLCHVRAPPPFSMGADDKITINGSKAHVGVNGTKLGVEPFVQGKNGVLGIESKNSFYLDGSTLLAISGDHSRSSTANGNHKAIGDSIIVMTPDYTHGSSPSNSALSTFMDSTGSMNGNGLSEVVSKPIQSVGFTKSGSTIMAGGHVWDIALRPPGSADNGSSSTLNLYFKSSTPSDSILESDIVRPFIPPTIIARRGRFMATSREKMLNSTSFEAAQTASEQNALKSGIDFFNGGFASLAIDMIGRLFLTKPVQMIRRKGQSPMYKVSNQSGCKDGFSDSAMESSGYKRKTPSRSHNIESQRLQPALLHPSMIPLPETSLQHVPIKTRQQGLIALNSGGLHYFSKVRPIDKLRGFLIESNTGQIVRDVNIKGFFLKYGKVDSSSMCLSIALDEQANDKLTRIAVQAALNFSSRPSMSLRSTDVISSSVLADVPSWSSDSGLDGYIFKPSSVHDGLLALTSRLLRPIWCKPAVVVTEGKIAKSKQHNRQPKVIPAKVELLLDEPTLDSIRRPLIRLQYLIKEVFQPAIHTVPGSQPNHGDAEMEIDVSESFLPEHSSLITSAIQYQTQNVSQRQDFHKMQYSDKELLERAQLYEERSIHAIYRIVSRSVQFLTLLSHLRRAHINPELPEVDFGYLHGLTFSQLVVSSVAQDRIDTVLTNLFTDDTVFPSYRSSNEVSTTSVESNNLSSTLSNQCYLYFSIGSRLTHIGFSHARAALSQKSSTNIRSELTISSSSYLQQAAYHWHNPILISGRLEDLSDERTLSYEDMAIKAHESGSPLARAAFVLMELDDVVGVVNICLTCAGNFGGISFNKKPGNFLTESQSGAIMQWEKGLYHQPAFETNVELINSSSNTMIGGTSDVERKKLDAKLTCHAVLFYYLNCLLNSANEHHRNIGLPEKMLSAATASSDINFLKELYGYLVSSGHVDTLLKIENPSLESWLENINKNPELLWRYYVIHDMHWLAGTTMKRHAITPDESLSLEERIQCLNRAANSFSNAIQNPPHPSMMERGVNPPSRDDLSRIVNEIREQMDIATLQSRVLSAVRSSKNASQVDKEKMRLLSSSLMNVSELYNDFAAKFNLFDLCLAIMQTCKCNDVLITTLWRSILCEELLPCSTKSQDVQFFVNNLQRGSLMTEESIVLTDSNITNEDGDSVIVFEDGHWILSMRHRIITLGKELQGKDADFVFPVDFITEQLEGLFCVFNSASMKQVAPWTVQTLVDAGTSFPSLLEAYNNLDIAHESGPSKLISRMTQLLRIKEVMNLWLKADSSVFGEGRDTSRTELRRYAPSLLQRIDEYKSSLESGSDWDSQDVRTLYEDFNIIEEALRRIY